MIWRSFVLSSISASIILDPLIIITPLFNWKKQVIAPIGVRDIGAGGLQHPHPHAPPNFGQLRFLGQQEKLGETKFLQSFHVSFRLFFSLKELFFYFEL